MMRDFLIKKLKESPQDGKQAFSSYTPFHDDFRDTLSAQ